MNVVFFDLEEQRPKGFITIREASEKWGLSERYLRKAIDLGHLRSIKVLTRRYVPDDKNALKKREPIHMLGRIREVDI